MAPPSFIVSKCSWFAYGGCATHRNAKALIVQWVEAQAETGRYSNASDYVRDLIRRDQEREAWHAELQAAVDVGVASGIGTRSMDELEQEALNRIARQAE